MSSVNVANELEVAANTLVGRFFQNDIISVLKFTIAHHIERKSFKKARGLLAGTGFDPPMI